MNRQEAKLITLDNLGYWQMRESIVELSRFPDLLVKELFKPTSDFIKNANSLIRMISYTPPEVLAFPEFREKFGEVSVPIIEDMIKEKIGYHKGLHSWYTAGFITNFMQRMDESYHDKIVDLIIKYNNNFCNKTRKHLSKWIIRFLKEQDDRASELFATFYRIYNKKDFEGLLEKTPNGINNAVIQEVINKKTNLFDYIKYKEEEVNNNDEQMVKLLKAIVKTNTILDRLDFVVKVEERHIKKLAPVQRFNFLRLALHWDISLAFSCKNRYYGNNTTAFGKKLRDHIYIAKKDHHSRIDMGLPTPEKIREYLFAVALKKNKVVSRFINRYEEFYCRMNIEKIEDLPDKYKGYTYY